MRKKVALGFILLSLVTVASGLYIMFHIERASTQLKSLLMSHQAEIIRWNLIERINQVQFDFFLIDTPYFRGVDKIIRDVGEMRDFAEQCFGCHHPPLVRQKLETIRDHIGIYKSALAGVLRTRVSHTRVPDEENEAFLHGQHLIFGVNEIINRASAGLAEKTKHSLENIEKTKKVLYGFLFGGPVLMAIFSFLMIGSITKPLGVILDAFGMLKRGNLDFRIKGPLKNEFAELASAFNETSSTLNEQMRKMQMTEQMAVCGQLAAGLAHEIKNPLAGIKAAVEVLSDESGLPQENRDLLQKVIAEIRRLESMMKNFLNFARPHRPQFSKVDINHILTATLDFMGKQTSSSNKTKSLEIVTEFKPLPEITADLQQLRQVFINLLLNAQEALPLGGTITIRTSYEDSGFVRVEIADTGNGIPQDLANKIFQPFFTTKPRGTGLGLAISKQLIVLHQGSLSVQNAPQGGAVFHIEIPVNQTERQVA
jgi:signal transduction histidine kinase